MLKYWYIQLYIAISSAWCKWQRFYFTMDVIELIENVRWTDIGERKNDLVWWFQVLIWICVSCKFVEFVIVVIICFASAIRQKKKHRFKMVIGKSCEKMRPFQPTNWPDIGFCFVLKKRFFSVHFHNQIHFGVLIATILPSNEKRYIPKMEACNIRIKFGYKDSNGNDVLINGWFNMMKYIHNETYTLYINTYSAMEEGVRMNVKFKMWFVVGFQFVQLEMKSKIRKNFGNEFEHWNISIHAINCSEFYFFFWFLNK